MTKKLLNQKIWQFQTIKRDHREFSAWDLVTIQIMATGSRDHEEYGEVKITAKDIQEFKNNFDSRSRGIDLVVDENHEWNHKALWIFRDLKIEHNGEALYADIELTRLGANLLTQGAYLYFSPEFFRLYKDEKTGKIYRNLLVGGAFTNRPFFKNMESFSPLLACEDDVSHSDKIDNTLFIFSDSVNMKKLLQLLKKFKESGKISSADQKTLEQLFSELPEAEKKSVDARVQSALSFSESDDDTDDDTDADTDTDDDSDDDATDDADTDTDSDDEDDDDDSDDEDDDDTDDTQKHSEKEVSIKASELNRLREVEAESTRKEIESKVWRYCFNDKLGEWSIMPQAIDAAKKFAQQLSARQRKMFFSFLKLNRVTTDLFSEVGSSKANPYAGMSYSEKIDVMAEEYMEANDCDYSEALKALSAAGKIDAEKYSG